MPSQIPIFWRVWFQTLDPLITLLGVYGTVVNPGFLLGAYAPAPALPPAPETHVALHQLAGFFASLAFLQAVLLRARPDDVAVWRIFQASTVLVDVGVVVGFLTTMRDQGRLWPMAAWRADEHNQIWGQAVFAVARAAFALGFGLGGAGDGAKGKSKKA